MLVSHWSVDDEATRVLMTEVFTRYARDKGARRSEALQQAMIAVMQQAAAGASYLAHPYAWAAFFTVGEGGQTRRGR